LWCRCERAPVHENEAIGEGVVGDRDERRRLDDAPPAGRRLWPAGLTVERGSILEVVLFALAHEGLRLWRAPLVAHANAAGSRRPRARQIDMAARGARSGCRKIRFAVGGAGYIRRRLLEPL